MYHSQNNNENTRNSKVQNPYFCKYCRGQVWWEQGVPHVGSVQASGRPVLIISDNAMNAVSSVVIVLPMTSKHKYKSESIFVLPFNEKSSVVLTDQPRTVPKECLNNYMYTLNSYLMEKITNSLLVSIGYLQRQMPIQRLSEEERNEELLESKKDVLPALNKEKQIIEEYLEGGIDHVSSLLGVGISSAYKKLNDAIDRCTAFSVYLDLVDKAKAKKEKNRRGKSSSKESPKAVYESNNSVEKAVLPLKQDVPDEEEKKSVSKIETYSDYEDISAQFDLTLNRGEMTNALREFKKTGHFIHPGTHSELRGKAKYNYLQALFDKVNNDPKLKRDIKKISTSLKYKINDVYEEEVKSREHIR